MTELLRELEAVVGLADKATPGPWVANDGELATDLYWANGSMTADALAEFADGLSDPPNASFVAAAVNFLRTHHAEIAEAVSQRDVLREMLRKTTAVAVTALFHSEPDDVIAAFPLDDLQAILTVSQPLADANVKVEAIYREAWDATELLREWGFDSGEAA